MNLNKKDRQVLIDSLSDRIKRNPYDTKARELLKKIKEYGEQPISKKDQKDGRFAKEAINQFYNAGVIPTIDAGKLTNKDIKRMADFIEISTYMDEASKDFYQKIKSGNFKNYEEFEPYVLEYAGKMIKFSKEIDKNTLFNK